MDIPISYLVNSGFGWFIVMLAVTGYFITLKRTHEKWLFWIVLAAGWAFFSIANTLLLFGVTPGSPYLIAIWLCSFVLVITSLVLLFLKISR